MITEPTYINVREFGRKIQQAFVSAARIYIDTSRLQALFILPDRSEYKYQEEYNEIWHYPINGDPTWFVVNRPYAPGDTL